MHAILVSEENVPEMIQTVPECDAVTGDVGPSALDIYLASKGRWYLVTGYVTKSGKHFNWTFIPGFVLEKNFEYDADKIRYTWDQIVRK
jgi:hypothetical protein